ncbi:hypothetical protein SK128_002232 [Halocaridina rubra]|uniref:CLIP domain-containing serine protease n=1 Tax=Halocaridina rubra TaxID=373956 RepID=A0AAN8X817_HALRR
MKFVCEIPLKTVLVFLATTSGHLFLFPASAQELVFENKNPADEALKEWFLADISPTTRISAVNTPISSGALCSTANQQPGRCLRVSQCPPYLPLMKEIQRPDIFNFFKSHICRLEITDVRICCATNPDLANIPSLRTPPQSQNFFPSTNGFDQNQVLSQGNEETQISFSQSSNSNPSENLPALPSNNPPTQPPLQSVPVRFSTQTPQGIFSQNSFGVASAHISGQHTTSLPIVSPAARPLRPSQNLPIGPTQEPIQEPQFAVSFAPDRQTDQEPQNTSPPQMIRPISAIIPSESDCGEASFVIRNNGSPTWPWLAAVGIKNEGNHFQVACGGALVTSRHVITAAHCMTLGTFGTPTHVRLGDYDLDRSNDIASPQDILIIDSRSPNFNANTFEGDIAILTLARDVNFSEFVQPICLPHRFQYDGFRYQSLRITGWARTIASKGRDGLPQTPQAFEASVIGLQDCQRTYQRTSSSPTVNRRNLCTTGGSPQDCLSDTSAPAVYFDEDTTRRYFLVGLASFGFGCDQPSSPVVYTRTGAFLNWILDTLQ